MSTATENFACMSVKNRCRKNSARCGFNFTGNLIITPRYPTLPHVIPSYPTVPPRYPTLPQSLPHVTPRYLITSCVIGRGTGVLDEPMSLVIRVKGHGAFNPINEGVTQLTRFTLAFSLGIVVVD